MDIKIRTDLSDFSSGIKILPREFRNATVAALNKTGTSVKAALKKGARQVYNIPAGRIEKALKIKKAWAGKLSVEIEAAGEPPGLQHYGARTKGLNRGHRLGGPAVSVMVIKGSRKPVQGAFMVGKGNKGIIFERTGGVTTAKKGGSKGKRREAIERLHGPAISSMLKNPKIQNVVIARAEQLMLSNMNFQITRRLQKHF